MSTQPDTGVLARILETKTKEVAALRATGLPQATFSPRPVVRAALERAAGDKLRLITEIKRRSPSAGVLSTALSPAKRALAYAPFASMISVLCDTSFFDGAFAHLGQVRRALEASRYATPLLAKEFVIDPLQLEAAARQGADAVLLIARIVSRSDLATLCRRARGLGLEPFVEVMSETELDAALAAHAEVIGVNARDLDSLAMDADNAANVLRAIPSSKVAVYLSGIKTAADVVRVSGTNAHAALVGEVLMRQDDPRLLLAELAAASGT